MGAVAAVLAVSVSGCVGTASDDLAPSGSVAVGAGEVMLAPATPPSPVTNPAIPVDQLVGKWTLREYIAEGGAVTKVDDDRARLLIFPSGRLIDISTCDPFDGDYVATDGEIQLVNQYAGPMLACYSESGSGRMWAIGVRLSLKGGELTATSTVVRPEDYNRDPADFVRTLSSIARPETPARIIRALSAASSRTHWADRHATNQNATQAEFSPRRSVRSNPHHLGNSA